MGEVHKVMYDLMKIARRKVRVLREKEQSKAQTRVMTVSLNPLATEDVLGS